MTNKKKFKVLKLYAFYAKNTGIKLLYAELTELQQLLPGFTYLPPVYNPVNYDSFVFLYNTDIARKILASPEENIELCIDDFEIKNAKLENSEKNTAYYHKEYIDFHYNSTYISEIDIEPSSELLNAIKECLFSYRIDSFFTRIFSLMFSIEYGLDYDAKTVDLNIFFERYKKLSAYILREITNIETVEYIHITDEDIQFYEEHYTDLKEYGKAYQSEISTYVVFSQNQKIIANELNEQNILYSKFFNLCMLEGYDIAINRLQKEINNTGFFFHQIIKTQNFKILKIFLTPYGNISINHIVDLANKRELDKHLDEYLKNNNITRIHDEKLKTRFRTRFIFKIGKQSGYFYYEKAKHVLFDEQDRKNPYTTLINEGQINLTWTNEI